MSPEIDTFVSSMQRRVEGFSNEMREKGIHVGLGSPPVCVTCRKPWKKCQGRVSGSPLDPEGQR